LGYNEEVKDKTVAALRRIALLTGLPDEALALLAESVVRRTYEPGETIIFAGDPCQAAYFVAEGRVRAYRLSVEGREQVLALLTAGQAFNTVPPFLPGGVNHANVEALTQVTVYVVARNDLVRLVGECDELAVAILRDFASRLHHLTNLVEDLSLRTVRGRLARFLLEQVDDEKASGRWTQDEIAARLGTVRDMVGRTLRAFAGAGLIQLDRQRIVLLDRDGLQRETRH